MVELGPSSPCLNICTLDERGVCRGCYRTLDEIAGWTRMGPADQWATVARADARTTGFPTAQDLGDPRAFAGNGDGGDPPGVDSQPQPHAAGIDGPTHASGKRRVNSAPPLGWLSAASFPPWRSTMP